MSTATPDYMTTAPLHFSDFDDDYEYEEEYLDDEDAEFDDDDDYYEDFNDLDEYDDMDEDDEYDDFDDTDDDY